MTTDLTHFGRASAARIVLVRRCAERAVELCRAGWCGSACLANGRGLTPLVPGFGLMGRGHPYVDLFIAIDGNWDAILMTRILIADDHEVVRSGQRQSWKPNPSGKWWARPWTAKRP